MKLAYVGGLIHKHRAVVSTLELNREACIRGGLMHKHGAGVSNCFSIGKLAYVDVLMHVYHPHAGHAYYNALSTCAATIVHTQCER